MLPCPPIQLQVPQIYQARHGGASRRNSDDVIKTGNEFCTTVHPSLDGAQVLKIGVLRLLSLLLLMMGSSSAGATKVSGLPESPYKRIVLGGGCFWCIEAVYARVDGVVSARSGYQGGHLQNPTYKAVCRGDTGHAEVVEVVYEPDKVALQELLDIFFQAHDPTTKDRQGNDVGTQYRSAIYYDDPQDREVIDTCMAAISSSKGWTLTTEVRQITPEMPFYLAEDHHLEYFENNQSAGYCRAVIAPKLKKISNPKFSEKGRL